jgi:hypothetical protein
MFVFVLGLPRAQALTIAEQGRATAVIVLAENAPEPVQYAAAELSNFLGQITGAEFKIVTTVPDGVTRLLVGPGAARVVLPDFTTQELGSDGIVIKTVGHDLVLAGGEPRGTLYAVYTFLEDELDCRWWSSRVSTIPKSPTIEVSELDVRYVPVFEYREPYWFDAFDSDWAVRNKSNGNRPMLDRQRGGNHIYYGFVHTFNQLIDPQKYFKDHPEWFSMINGKRTDQRSQLCLTNEAMKEELIKNLKAGLRQNPKATIASVSQNDWHGNCQCGACAAIEKEEGSPAGLMLRFVNSVAQAIEEEFPDVAVSTLAYQYTRKPPTITQPRDNVIVRLCSIECSFSVPLVHERNQAFRDDIIGWSKLCNRLYIWDYTTNFSHHIMPHPNLRVLGPNVEFFANHHVKGVFEQGAYTTNGAEMAELRAWVLAKLLWNPKLNAQALIDEFLAGYFGAAGPHIKAYLELMHRAVEDSEDWLGCFSNHKAKFLSLATLSTGFAHLKAAEQSVADEPDLAFRVQVAQLPILYTFMMRWKEFRDQAETAGTPWPMPESIRQTYDDFVKIARQNNITRLSEWKEGYGVLEEAVEKNAE